MSSTPGQNQLNFTSLAGRFSLTEAWHQYTSTLGRRLAAWGYATLLIIILVYAVFAGSGQSPSISPALAFIGGTAFGYFSLKSWFNTGKMRQFARQNQLRFVKNSRGSDYDGMIFGIGHSRQTTGYMMPEGSAIGALANYSYTVGSGRHRRTYQYGFVRVKLPRRLPHMVLDARKNNFLGISSLARSFKSVQKLQLEGDFNQYFTLYAPKQYERDALYVFTPDIMQILVDSLASYDVEIINDSLYIYKNQPLRLADQTEVENVVGIANKLATKLGRRVDYYADERVDNREINMVAAEGSRLKTGVSTLTIIIVAIFIAFYLLPVLLDVMAR